MLGVVAVFVISTIALFVWVANVFVDSGTGNPAYHQMAAGDTTDVPASASGDSFFIQAQGGPGVETVQVATVHRASDCHAQAQALLASSPS